MSRCCIGIQRPSCKRLNGDQNENDEAAHEQHGDDEERHPAPHRPDGGCKAGSRFAIRMRHAPAYDKPNPRSDARNGHDGRRPGRVDLVAGRALDTAEPHHTVRRDQHRDAEQQCCGIKKGSAAGSGAAAPAPADRCTRVSNRTASTRSNVCTTKMSAITQNTSDASTSGRARFSAVCFAAGTVARNGGGMAKGGLRATRGFSAVRAAAATGRAPPRRRALELGCVLYELAALPAAR